MTRYTFTIACLAALLAGCSAPAAPASHSEAGVADLGERSPGLAPVEHPVAIAIEGDTGAAACVPIGLLVCGYFFVTEHDSVLLYDVNATAARANLTLTWTPAGPTTQELAIGAYVIHEEDRYGRFQNLAHVSGPSPLQLEFAASALPAGIKEFLVQVDTVPTLTSPTYVWAHQEQPFTLVGDLVLTTLAEAPVPSCLRGC